MMKLTTHNLCKRLLSCGANADLIVTLCRWSGTLSNFMKETTHHLCKRLVAEHYASMNARSGSDSGDWLLADYRRVFCVVWSLVGKH